MKDDLNTVLDIRIKDAVKAELRESISLITDTVADIVSEQTKTTYGKWLSPKQAMLYLGFKTPKQMLSKLAQRGINPVEIAPNTTRFDRDVLDKLAINDNLQNLIDSL